MPIKFSEDQEPVKTTFDFEGYILNLKERIKNLYFADEWSRFWIQKLVHLDINLKKDIDNGYSPVTDRREQAGKNNEHYNYEIFSYKVVTDYGVYDYHFDIDAMKSCIDDFPIQTIALNDVYVDPSTEYLEDKINHIDPPLFLRFFGTQQPFICIDGNKRMIARMKEGQSSFEAHIIYENHLNNLFFTYLDWLFYHLQVEIEVLLRGIHNGKSEDDLFEQTSLYQSLNN